MTVHPSGYATADALWTAVTARSKIAARMTTGMTVPNLQRQFVYDRFLARMFTHAPDGTWVLKGGTALLARVRSARHSLDVDLFRRSGSLDQAVAEVKTAAALDLDDHLRFVTGDASCRAERPGQPGSELATLSVDTYVGVRSVQRFSVDIVIGSIITADPELHRPTPSVSLPALVTPPYVLYPVVDHVADKLCATVELHGSGQVPSSRHRDLVDLVIIARTQTVDADALRRAVTAEVDHRRLPSITRWNAPDGWATGYPRIARGVTECREYCDYAAATALISSFLDPVLAHGLTAATWCPTQLCWNEHSGLDQGARTALDAG